MVDKNDFEAGDEPVQVKRSSRAGVVVSVRLSPEEADRLQDIAEERRTTLSQIAREAVALYLRVGPTGGRAAGSPWTGTTTEHANLELVVQSLGPTVRTSGCVQAPV